MHLNLQSTIIHTLAQRTRFSILNQELSSDRLLRCIVFVAKGDLNRLEKAIDLAKEDYRDLIVWAEYDEKSERVRDLRNPF